MSDSLHLFDAFGVELEYMIVDSLSLNVRPIADRLIQSACGRVESEIERGLISWSNELALHVIELKTTGPAQKLCGLAEQFQQNVADANLHLHSLGGRLLPSAMHPWMDPFKEMKLWPHEYNEVYEAFNRIFDCRGHGWANLQSVHLNLPFCGDDEFGRLHAAVRLILPLLPGLAASSPVMDGSISGMLDSRLEVYRTNSRRVPSVAGHVIPEQAFTREEYDRLIFQPLYADIAPLDPDGVLQHEFLNARGAIARFDRGAIEIRVIDIQECPAADVAVLQTTVAVLEALVAEKWSDTDSQRNLSVERLYTVLCAAIRDGEQALITDSEYLRLFGITENACRVGDVWRHLVHASPPVLDSTTEPALEMILNQGTLSRRILDRIQAANGAAFQQSVKEIYSELADCLTEGQSFKGTVSS